MKCSLIKEGTIEAKQGGERGVTARSIRKVTGVSSLLSPRVEIH